MSTKEEALKKIEEEVKNNKIIIYMKGTKDFPQCGFSAQAAECLKRLNVPFEDRNVLENEDYWNYLEVYSKWPTFPQIFIDGKLIGGCDIVTELFQSGELKKLADEAVAK